jgi:phospholipid/cholesterol/gamma-HCH transport system substrate-binding protein
MNRWQRRWKRIKNVPGLARNLVAVAGAILAGVLVVTYFLTNVKFIPPWEDRFVFTADFESADALSPQSSPKVRVAGVDVGQVTDVELTDEGEARVTMSLEEGYEIYQDASAVLRPKSVLNEMYVEIAPGHPSEGVLENGGAIAATNTARPVQVDEVFENLDDRARQSLSDLLAMADAGLATADRDLPAGLEALETALHTYRPVLQQLSTRRDTIAALVTAISRIAEATGANRDRSARLVASLEKTLTVLAHRQDELVAGLAEVPGLGDDLRGATQTLSDLAGVLNPTLRDVRRASTTLPPTIERLTRTVGNVRRTFDAARPVVHKARPLVNLLGPVMRDARHSLQDLAPVSARFDPALDLLMPHLVDLQAFVYNTSGVMTASDATGGMIRGHVTVPLPYGALIAGTNGGYPSPLEHGGAR